MVELDDQCCVEGGGYFGEGSDGEVLVAGLYAGDHGLGGSDGFSQLALGHAGFRLGLMVNIHSPRIIASPAFFPLLCDKNKPRI